MAEFILKALVKAYDLPVRNGSRSIGSSGDFFLSLQSA